MTHALRSPAPAEIDRRMESTLGWILHAYRMAGDGGISKGYHLLRRRWFPSYPETTAYTIPSLLNAEARLNRPAFKDLAVDLADYLLATRSADGGIRHWQGTNTVPLVFDTGQAIFGWLAAYQLAGHERHRHAAETAGRWLVGLQDRDGSWHRGQHMGVVKVIDTRVAWALLELHRVKADHAYREAAIANLNWALEKQDSDGWFRRCALVEGEDPLTHTLAYTAEGLLESGRVLGDDRFVGASRKTADALVRQLRTDGWLSSTYAQGWRRTSRSSCLTGNCQIAGLWLTFHRLYGDAHYLEAAERAISFVMSRQRLDGGNSHVRGGIPGSAPVYGRYERFKYPNWAAKFYLDALLALDSVRGRRAAPGYAG